MSTLQVNSITGSEGQPLDQWLTTWLGKAGNWSTVDRIKRPDYLGQNQGYTQNTDGISSYFRQVLCDTWLYAYVDLTLMTASGGSNYQYQQIYVTKDSTFASYTVLGNTQAYVPNGNFQGTSYFIPKGHWYKVNTSYGGARTLWIIPLDTPGRS